ncbi:MAG: hypothetical protein ABFC63_05505 [Thermoguttaceae bacterium]
MAVNANKLAPRVVALIVVGYFVWPSVGQLLESHEPKKPPQTTELAASLLRPPMLPPPKKDPFGLPATTPGDSAKGQLNGRVRIAAGGAFGAGTPSNSDVPGLTLEGTCIVADQRLAIINGQVYGPKESVAGTGPAAGNYRVLDVFPDRVLVQCDGKQMELRYSNALASKREDSGPFGQSGVRDAAPRGSAMPSSQPFRAGR